MLVASISFCHAQKSIRDESITFQQERMVFKQWDRSKFTPTSGWLGINPYYLLTWALHPNYPKTDLRPLSISGPQTSRLSFTGAMQSFSRNAETNSDSLARVAEEQIYSHSAFLSDADPLWMLFYSRQLKPVIEFEGTEIFKQLPENIRSQFIEDGTWVWYSEQLNEIAQRLNFSRTSDQDRGTRMLSYHRILLEYRKVQALWSSKVAAAQRNIQQRKIREKLVGREIDIPKWQPQTDVEIAREILRTRKY